MLAVHAVWSPGRGVVLWAEDGDRPAAGRSRSLSTARPHPFAATAAALGALHPGKPTALTLLLPSRPTAPVASPKLVRTGGDGRAAPARGRPTLRPWTVPGLVVDVAELDDPADEARYGGSVAHLRALAELAADLARRGRVLPTVDRGPDGVLASWRPVVQGLDAAAFDALVGALPPVGRAEAAGPRDTTGADPRGLLTGALATLTDDAVRDRLARRSDPAPLLPARPPWRAQRPPAVEAWLAALLAPDGRFDATGTELDTLVDAVAAWDRVGAAGSTRGRACFRLVELATLHDPADPDPDPLDQTGDGTRWAVEFLLQSATDESLLVPADQVWDGRAGRLLTDPEELLLGELGRAALVVPALSRALRETRPSRLDLDPDGAHRFLTADAALLLQAGFGVQLPAGWDGARRVGLSLRTRSTPADRVLTRAGLGREQLADFRWSVAVGDDELGEDELADLVATKAPLVRLRGRWVAVDPQRLAAGLQFLRRARPAGGDQQADPPDGPTAWHAGPDSGPVPVPTVAQLLTLAGQHPDDPFPAGALAGGALADLPLPVTALHADGWIGDLLDGTAERTLAPIDPPPGFTATLRPYQQRGVSWLAFLARIGLGACLADDMGLGKTVQLLALEAHERFRPVDGSDPESGAGSGPGPDHRPGPTLLVCPMSLVGTWVREAARFTPELRVLAHHGTGRAHGAELTDQIATHDLVVTTYATAARDADDLTATRWHRLVLDEAQAVKNSRSGHARAVRRFDAGHRVALTGTPVENRLSELWSIMDVVNPGLLGSATAFRARYAVPIERHGATEPAQLLRRVTRPYLLRRVKTDPTVIDDLPEKIEITQHHRLTREQASLYRTVVDDMMERIADSEGIERRGNVLAAMAKLKQVCNHPAQLLHDGSPIGRRSGKVIRLEEVLSEVLAAGDRALCFTQFAEFGTMLVPHLSARFDTEVAFLHGGTPARRRDDMVTRFQRDDGPSIMLLSLKAGGTGLTLTAANHVLHLDRWWNPAVEDQATDRAFRIGQRRNVQVHRFVCPGTVEERIDEMIGRKRALSRMVVADGEDWLTDLSTDALREVLELGSEALAGYDDPDVPDA